MSSLFGDLPQAKLAENKPSDASGWASVNKIMKPASLIMPPSVLRGGRGAGRGPAPGVCFLFFRTVFAPAFGSVTKKMQLYHQLIPMYVTETCVTAASCPKAPSFPVTITCSTAQQQLRAATRNPCFCLHAGRGILKQGSSLPSAEQAASDDGSRPSTSSASIFANGSIKEEYDPLKPNDYELVIKERERRKKEAEIAEKQAEIQVRRTSFVEETVSARYPGATTCQPGGLC